MLLSLLPRAPSFQRSSAPSNVLKAIMNDRLWPRPCKNRPSTIILICDQAWARSMKRFIQGEERTQDTLLPRRLDDYIAEDNPVRVMEVFVEALDLGALGFEGVTPSRTGRPAYHPVSLLKLYLYGYLNRIQSSRRLERECQRNVEVMWLTGRLMPDFKTIASFRKDNGEGIRNVCRQFIMLCRRIDLFSEAVVAIDGSKFKAVNHRDRNFTNAKMQRRLAEINASIERYLAALDT